MYVYVRGNHRCEQMRHKKKIASRCTEIYSHWYNDLEGLTFLYEILKVEKSALYNNNVAVTTR